METSEIEIDAKKKTTYNQNNNAKNWIAGEWVDSEKFSISYNPATGQQIGSYADGGRKEAKNAVEAALKAFRETSWKNDFALRSKVLLAMAELIEAESEALILILSLETGKIIPEATMEVFAAPALLRYWAGKTFTSGRSGETKPGCISITIREAVGVAGIIVPFNAPVALLMRALAPALAAGTAVVAKLPGLTAQTNKLLCKIISETPGLPKGIVNVITESGNEAAKFLVQSSDVPVISFTGSTQTGKAIVAAGASHLKRFSLELGGKTPMIVFDDADVRSAIYTMEKAITIFSGQFCMTGSRILVQRKIADSVIKGLADRLANIKVGPASDPLSEMGSMIDMASVKRVNNMVEEAIAGGAEVIVRGGQVTEGIQSKGAFYRPTLLLVTNPELPLVQQEVFGPVATLQVFDTEEEAISLANNSVYGLAASIWTRDVDRPWRVAKAIQAGTIWINTYAQIFAQFEEGGYKQSGSGRLNGEAALEDFLEYKHITFNPGFA
jgi:betaine-aldehyde dehydrogenase